MSIASIASRLESPSNGVRHPENIVEFFGFSPVHLAGQGTARLRRRK